MSVNAISEPDEVGSIYSFKYLHFLNKKYIFYLKKKRNVLLNKMFVFHKMFKLDFMMQIIYCIIHKCLYSPFILFCSLISVSKKRDVEGLLVLSYSYKWHKFNKMNEKRSLGYQSV